MSSMGPDQNSYDNEDNINNQINLPGTIIEFPFLSNDISSQVGQIDQTNSYQPIPQTIQGPVPAFYNSSDGYYQQQLIDTSYPSYDQTKTMSQSMIIPMQQQGIQSQVPQQQQPMRLPESQSLHEGAYDFLNTPLTSANSFSNNVLYPVTPQTIEFNTSNSLQTSTSTSELPITKEASRNKNRKRADAVYDMSSETAKRNRCRICNKQFKRPSSLQTHYYSHTGEKIFKCPWNNCGKLFSVKSNMTRHYRLHERDFRRQQEEVINRQNQNPN